MVMRIKYQKQTKDAAGTGTNSHTNRGTYGLFPHADLYSGLQWASQVQTLTNRHPETATRVLLDLLPDGK